MVPTWPNVQTIRLAIESEAECSEVSLSQAAGLIITAAQEISRWGELYVPPSRWEERQLQRQNDIDRFWFEDSRWRTKHSYFRLLERLRASSAPAEPQ
jgi:hypothetical protein